MFFAISLEDPYNGDRKVTDDCEVFGASFFILVSLHSIGSYNKIVLPYSIIA